MAQEQKIMLPMDVNTRQLMMILNHVYPVGSYYETSDEDFDPNDSFVGEWSLEESGIVHVSAGAGYNIGKKGGEAAHTLTSSEMPLHTHTFTTGSAGAHTHKTGYKRADAYGTGNKDAMHYSGTFNVTSSSAGEHTHGGTTNGAGGGQAHNNMPPYITVNRWHRNN